MIISDDFAILQAEANSKLELMPVSDGVRNLVIRGRRGEFTTTEIIKMIIDGTVNPCIQISDS